MKEHIVAKMVNALRDCAIKYHDYGCLRELILGIVSEAFKEQEEWDKSHNTTEVRCSAKQSDLVEVPSTSELQATLKICHNTFVQAREEGKTVFHMRLKACNSIDPEYKGQLVPDEFTMLLKEDEKMGALIL